MRYVQDFSMEAARLHARLPAHKRAVERAAGRVREALAAAPGTWAVGCSGGKDSTAALAVAVEAGWRGPVFHFAYRGDYDPQPTANACALAVRWGLPFVMVEVASEMEAIDRVGADRFFAPGAVGQEAVTEAARWWERTYKAELTAFQERQGWTGIIMGMRREESMARAITISRKGWLYRVASRPGWTCCPLHDWSGRDVWAAILGRGLPYLARYDEAEDRVWERSDDAWFAPNVWARGMARRIQLRDPELWHALVERYPGLSQEL
ncbi:Phosphoadenosine phosphosulfate reductase family protein (plasmid) [Rhodovastum atsumiense]|uniref:Phosphoadenosine phosphosulfate reductase family protein n=1 Tax=Rhodovastum atsumiense TaxID=504468 RepID=A0A5M6IWH0_9PROT|nr:phosphoadenosine phosphosulfate reductase family protein [Rhodovastum atsumiense]KAA5611808.1 phosphoadenosine phosphosulfate reductase family protein [Rhodovastum atsumiense]CAH2606084.1 Phosphoadenosine phosphosulfate reductase family protein [Rhodovastum atsumiense]